MTIIAGLAVGCVAEVTVGGVLLTEKAMVLPLFHSRDGGAVFG